MNVTTLSTFIICNKIEKQPFIKFKQTGMLVHNLSDPFQQQLLRFAPLAPQKLDEQVFQMLVKLAHVAVDGVRVLLVCAVRWVEEFRGVPKLERLCDHAGLFCKGKE